ncbi:MAG: DUF7932 domain-containing protein [Bdellovibrionales bacterium]
MKVITLLFASFLFSAQAQASVKVSNGTVTINVSGADATEYSGSGSSAGSADITLAYADAAKTQVSITGTTIRFGKTETVKEQIALSDLKSILIYAVGGEGGRGSDGYSGSSGSNGSDGSNGSNGSDGCPPGDGGRGGDGTNGGDGGSGGNGGDGGHGGNGGLVKVNTSPDQSELMLFVKISTAAGSGGAGGSGGSGGSGGRGGSAGSGGRGGSNTCKDDKGNPTNGPDGSNGWNGSSGRDGNSGSSGYSGRGGGSGRSGARSYNLVAGANVQTFAAPFDLEITAATFIDDTADAILEPGERAYLSSLTVTNKGPMPSPAGQTIKFAFLNSSTLTIPAPLAISLAPIAPGANSVVNLQKGALTLQVPDVNGLIGKKAVANGRLSINNVTLDSTVDSGMAIHWPISLNATVAKSSHLFDIAKPLAFTLKNVGTQALGPNGTQPLHVAITWTSKTVPGSDVTVTLADGRAFNLAKSAIIPDLSVPANATAPLALTVLVRDSKGASSGSGVLTVSLRLRDFNSPDDNVVQSLDTAITLNLDLKSIEWAQTVNLAGAKVQCLFPSLPTPAQQIASFQVTKAKGTDKVVIQVAVPGSTSAGVSPAITVSDAHMLPFYEQFSGAWTPQNAVDFLNKFVGPSTPKGAWTFKSCSLLP